MDEKQTRSLPVKLEESEVAAKSQELVAKIQELKTAEINMKSVAKTMKEEIDGLDKEVVKLARIVRDKIEDRQVECIEKNNHEAFIVETYRCDTMELVCTRTMTQNERQLIMFPVSKLKAVNESPSQDETVVTEVPASQEGAATQEMAEASISDHKRKKTGKKPE